MAGIALGQEGTGVGRLCRLMRHCGCCLSAPLFLVLLSWVSFCFIAILPNRSEGLLVSSEIQVALNEQLWTMWSSF